MNQSRRHQGHGQADRGGWQSFHVRGAGLHRENMGFRWIRSKVRTHKHMKENNALSHSFLRS